MEALARRALARSQALGWNLLDLPAQLRISTIDSFCRDLALQQPLLTGLGGELDISEQPRELYRRAARRTLEAHRHRQRCLRAAIESLLLWRDNGWQEIEDLLVEMLEKRDRWMHDFVLEREPDWEALRDRLERPFAQAVRDALDQARPSPRPGSGAREEALALARFACDRAAAQLHSGSRRTAEFPAAPFTDARHSKKRAGLSSCLADLLLTQDGAFRKQVDKTDGFPPRLASREKDTASRI